MAPTTGAPEALLSVAETVTGDAWDTVVLDTSITSDGTSPTSETTASLLTSFPPSVAVATTLAAALTLGFSVDTVTEAFPAASVARDAALNPTLAGSDVEKRTI